MFGTTGIVPTLSPLILPKNEMKKKPMFLHEAPGGLAPLMNRSFDARFKSTAAYRATLPDIR